MIYKLNNWFKTTEMMKQQFHRIKKKKIGTRKLILELMSNITIFKKNIIKC